jgi:hypothetical protein
MKECLQVNGFRQRALLTTQHQKNQDSFILYEPACTSQITIDGFETQDKISALHCASLLMASKIIILHRINFGYPFCSEKPLKRLSVYVNEKLCALLNRFSGFAE